MLVLGQKMSYMSYPRSLPASTCSIRVVYDIAEHGVALMNEYNKLKTNNKVQQQFLLLVVKEYCHRYPDGGRKDTDSY